MFLHNLISRPGLGIPRYAFGFLLLLAASVAVGCKAEPDSAGGAQGTISIIATTYPLTYFAERIVQKTAVVSLPLPTGADPATWNPPLEVIEMFQLADLIVANGAGLEPWIDRVSLPASRLVMTAASLQDEWIELPGTVSHAHGPEGEHAHGLIDPHTWLDPQNAIRQAAAIRDALARHYPEHTAVFDAGLTALASDLASLDLRIQQLSTTAPELPLMAAQPEFNYLARRYSWNLVSLSLDPEHIPEDHTIEEMRRLLVEHPAAFLIWASPPQASVVRAFEEKLGLGSVVFRPCETVSVENTAGNTDYLQCMNENVSSLAPVFARGRS